MVFREFPDCPVLMEHRVSKVRVEIGELQDRKEPRVQLVIQDLLDNLVSKD